MASKYNSPLHQQNVYDNLCTLRFADFVTSTTTMRQALTIISNKITNDLPQCPAPCRSELVKIDILKHDVLLEPCADNPINTLATIADKLLYSFLTSLVTALNTYTTRYPSYSPAQAKHEKQPSSSLPHAFTTFLETSLDEPTPTTAHPACHFAGKGRYKFRQASFRRHPPGTSETRRCYNCGKAGCMAYKCSHPFNSKRVLANRTKDLQTRHNISRLKAAQRALVEFLKDFDAAIHMAKPDTITDADPEDDFAYFLTAATTPPYNTPAEAVTTAITSTPQPTHTHTSHFAAPIIHIDDLSSFNSLHEASHYHFMDNDTDQKLVHINVVSPHPIHIPSTHPSSTSYPITTPTPPTACTHISHDSPKFLLLSSHSFLGAVVDTGATKSVIGLSQAKHY